MISSILNYSTFTISLSRELKNCKVTLLNNTDQFSGIKFIDELELFFDWLTNKTEIASVIIESQNCELNLLSKKDLKYLDENALNIILKKIQRISWGQIVLPQTVIWNFQANIDLLTLELCAGADLRVASSAIEVSFDSLSMGICPMSGASSLLTKISNQTIIKSYILMGKTVNANELVKTGIFHGVCSESEIDLMIEKISKQSPIARIQYKRSVNDELICGLEETMTSELSFAKASLAIGDWKKWSLDHEFANPREFSKLLRRTPTQADMQRQEKYLA